MTDNNNLQQFLDQMGSYSEETSGDSSGARSSATTIPSIGQVVEIAGSGSRSALDKARRR